MSIIIDLIIVAIIALCIFIGYRKGLTGCLIKIVSFVLALVIAFILFKPVSNLIINNTNWDENLEQSIKETFLKEKDENREKENAQSMPDVIMQHINETVENAADDAKNAIVESTARNVAVTIINIAVAILLFIVAKILLLLVKGLASLLTRLPIIKQCDKVGGIIYGLLQSLIIIYIVLAIISFFSSMLSETEFISELQKSYIGSVMYNNNLLLKIIF